MDFTKEIRIHRKYLPKLLERVMREQINGTLLLCFYQQMSCDGLSESRIVKVIPDHRIWNKLEVRARK